jgi:PAS domain S-box-containing protein
MEELTGEDALAAMEAAMDGVAILDRDDEYTYVNETHARLYGYDDPAALEGTSWRQLYDATEIERFESEVFPALDREGQWRGEAVGRTRDGERFDQELSLSRLENGALVCIVRDITARKRREQQLRLVQDASRALMHTTDETEVAGIAIEIAEEILDHRMTACWAYDEDAHELTPLAATDGVREMLDDAGLGALPPLGPDSYEMEVFEAGEPVLVEDYQQSVAGEADTPLRTVLMLPIDGHGVLHVGSTERREVTDEEQSLLEIFARHLAEAFERTEREGALEAQRTELETQNERLETFAAAVAHDLRNPLGVAQGHLELAMGEEREDPHLQTVAEAHDRMEQLIEELLTLARQGQTVVEPAPVALDAVAENALDNVSSTGVTLRLAEGAAVRLLADRSRLCELFENLLDNAVEHAVAAGGDDADEAAVEVRVGRLADGFYVADDGPGVPEAERDRVFDTGYTTADDGTGFGLSIVEQICDGHGWDVAVAESAAGGARFEITGVEFA